LKSLSGIKEVSILIILLVSSFSFSQDTLDIMNALQSNWDLCKPIKNIHHCETSTHRVDCSFQINFKENQFILYKEATKIDIGTYEVEHHYDEVFFMKFYSSLKNEISKLLGTDTVRLLDKEDGDFALFVELTSNIFLLKQQHIED